MDLEYFDRIVRNFDGSIDRFQRAVEQLDGLVFRMEKLSERSESAAPEQALLKGLTEAGERRVFTHRLTGPHFENAECAGICTLMPTDEAAAWVARQRKDSHAG